MLINLVIGMTLGYDGKSFFRTLNEKSLKIESTLIENQFFELHTN